MDGIGEPATAPYAAGNRSPERIKLKPIDKLLLTEMVLSCKSK